MAVRVMFDIDETNIKTVLKQMGPYMLGPALMAVIDDDATPSTTMESPADLPQPSPTKNGQSLPGNAKNLKGAVAVLQRAGNKGMGSAAFHAAMGAKGFDKQASYNALFNAKRRGLARQNKSNKRLYITRQGMSLTE